MQKAELRVIEEARAAGQPIPERQYTDDKMPKVDKNLMPKGLRGKSFEQLAAMQAQSKKAPPAPSSPVSTSGGRPTSSSVNRQTSSSPETPQMEQAASGKTFSATATTAEVPSSTNQIPPSKSVKAKLFPSGQSSPDNSYSSSAAANTSQRLQPDLPQSTDHQQLLDQLSQQQQQQNEPRQQQPEQQQQLMPAVASLPQQQQQSGMQQLVKPFGPATLRESIKLQLLEEAPSGNGLPENVRQYFKQIISGSLDLSMEKYAMRQEMEQRDAKVHEYRERLEEVQGQLEYQAEQMMDLQTQV